MSTLNSSLKAPTDIHLSKATGKWPVEPASNRYDDPFAFPAGSTAAMTFYITFSSPYKSFQIRWRTRTHVAGGAWREWNAWEGWETCSAYPGASRKGAENVINTTPAAAKRQNWDQWDMCNARPAANRRFFDTTVEGERTHYVPLYFSPYVNDGPTASVDDMLDLQVQVRGFDESSKKHGNTAEKTLKIRNYPEAPEIVSFTLQDDGSLDMVYAPHWRTGGNTVEVYVENPDWDGSNEPYRLSTFTGQLGGSNSFPGPAVTRKVNIPKASLPANFDVGDTINAFVGYTTTSGYSNTATGIVRTVLSKYSDGDPAPSPVMQPLSVSGHALTATITEAAGDYAWLSCSCWANWTGPDGASHTANPTATVSKNLGANGTAKRCVYRFANLPADVTVTVYARVTNAASDGTGNGYTQVSRTARLASGNRAWLSAGDAIAGFEYFPDSSGMGLTRTFAADTEAEKCAGRKRPVARHGVGGSNSIVITGAVPVETGRQRSGYGVVDWEKVKEAAGSDGVLMLPGGWWYKVAIVELNIDTANPIHTVTATLEEVS